MDLLIFAFGMLGLIVGVILLLLGFLKKKKMKGGLVIGVSLLLCLIGLLMPTSGKDTEIETATAEKEVMQEETAEEKAVREAKEAEEKAANEQKAKEEAEAKAQAEEAARVKAEQEAAERKQLAIANARSITFPMLNKAADRYKGEPYYIKGKVIQALEENNYTIMRVNMTAESWGYTDTVWVEYANITDAVEGSVVEVYGEVFGSHTYDTAIGGQMSLPAILASEVNILE